MADITAQQAQDLIYRSMLTGVPTSEFDAAGGYEKVYDLAKAAGGDMGRPSDAAIQKYGPTIAAQGSGNSSYAPGSVVNDPALQAAGYDNYYDQSLKKPSTSYLQKQIADLQKSYNDLVTKGTGKSSSFGGSGGTVTSGGGMVDAGGSTPTTPNTGGTTGAVYGPDGAMYSSAAAAIAAGVKNFTTTKPVVQSSDNLISPAGIPGTAANGFILDAVQSGNSNPGGLISGANKQLFKNKVGVQMPPNY